MKAIGKLLLTGIALSSLGASAPDENSDQIVQMRRLTEAQYRNSIADIFGPDIQVAGRFEPIVRPQHQLIATGAASATISPAGLEQFDAMARNIAAQVFDEKHLPFFVPCKPADPAKADSKCAQQTLAPLARYLFRRPQSAQTLAVFANIASRASDQAKSFNKGLELALAAMLVSPHFLYVIESAKPGEAQIDAYSRASRLSYLLWNSAPNDVLLASAERGDLDDQTKLELLVSRMVASPRFEQGVRAFFADMLLFEKFDELSKDPLVFPRFNQDVAKALPEQMLRTITDQLVVRGGDYRDLFTIKRTFMTRALGPVYQVPVRNSTGWEAFDFPEGDDRAGLLGQAGFLALYSHSGRSSPTLRGRAVRELLMCQPVPNPPGNVNFTAVQDVTSTVRPTARDRLQVHADDPSCSGCHVITDPIGLSLEKFDGLGSGRQSENGAVIDTAGMIDSKPFEGARGLGSTMASNPATTQCVASRAYEYATGRAEENADAVAKTFASQGYKIASLFIKIATMPEAYRVASPAQIAIASTEQRP